MSEIRPLGTWLERFFLEHILTERNLAINTRDSYRDIRRANALPPPMVTRSPS